MIKIINLFALHPLLWIHWPKQLMTASPCGRVLPPQAQSVLWPGLVGCNSRYQRWSLRWVFLVNSFIWLFQRACVGFIYWFARSRLPFLYFQMRQGKHLLLPQVLLGLLSHGVLIHSFAILYHIVNAGAQVDQVLWYLFLFILQFVFLEVGVLPIP